MGVTAKLTSIDLNIGKTINFDYQDGLYNWFNYSESFHSEYPLLLGGSDDYRVIPTLTGVDYHLKMLKKITTDKAVIDFNPEDRADLYAGVNNATPPKRIGSVDISDAVSGKKIKTLKFNYDYFQGTITNSYLTGNVTNAAALADADAKRLKLTSVQETGYTTAGVQVVKPPYTFSYNEATALPIKSSFSTDFWGYYNAQINSKAIPDLSVFYLSDDPDYAAMPAGLMTSFQGANRSPDTAKMKAGLLTKIVYPTGGTTAFTYEPNTFGNYAYPDINKIQNSSHNGYVSDYNVSSDVKTLTFSLPKTEIITFNVIITKGPNPARTYAEIQPSTVVLSKTVSGVTTTLKTWQMVTSQDEDDFNNSGTKQWNDAITLTYDANATYTITADMPDGIGPQGTSSDDASVSANFFYYSLPADYQTSYGGGVRVATIKNYTQTGGVASNKVIKYLNPDNSTSGILMSPVKPLYKRTMYGVIHSGVVPVDEYRGQVKDVWFISSESSVPFSDSAEGSVVGYSTVEEDEVAPDGSINGRHVFYYNNLESESHPNVPNNPQPLNGLISKEQVFSNTSTIPLTETNFSYININTWLYQGFKVANTFVGDNMCGSGSGYSIGIVDNDSNVLSSPIAYEHYYRIYTYPLNSYWSMLSGKTVTNNFNGQSLTSAENYFYNNKGQVVETASQNSKQETLTVKDIYPLDNPTDPMSAELISQNLYNSLQQKIILNNNAEQSHKYISYRDFNGLAVQNDVTGTFLGATLSPEPPLTDVTFDVYGPNKTVRQVTQKGVTTVLVWAFNNSFPLAEIKNTTYAAVQTALGGQSAVDAFGLTSPTKAAIDAFLAPLRSGTLTNALVTTFSIDPLIGMTSSTDEKGISTYYEYDDYQRLMNIKDKDGNIVKHIDYHYQGQ
jgi:YD repeat-containing protein